MHAAVAWQWDIANSGMLALRHRHGHTGTQAYYRHGPKAPGTYNTTALIICWPSGGRDWLAVCQGSKIASVEGDRARERVSERGSEFDRHWRWRWLTPAHTAQSMWRFLPVQSSPVLQAILRPIWSGLCWLIVLATCQIGRCTELPDAFSPNAKNSLHL